MHNKTQKHTKMNFLLIAYWYEYQWKKFVGATVKIWDLAYNLSRIGHEVTIFLPRYGFARKNLPLCQKEKSILLLFMRRVMRL